MEVLQKWSQKETAGVSLATSTSWNSDFWWIRRGRIQQYFWYFRKYLILSKTVSLHAPWNIICCYVIILRRHWINLSTYFIWLFVIISLKKKIWKQFSLKNLGSFGILSIVTYLGKKDFPQRSVMEARDMFLYTKFFFHWCRI